MCPLCSLSSWAFTHGLLFFLQMWISWLSGPREIWVWSLFRAWGWLALVKTDAGTLFLVFSKGRKLRYRSLDQLWAKNSWTLVSQHKQAPMGIRGGLRPTHFLQFYNRSRIHLEFILVYDVRYGSNLSFFYISTQLFQHHLLKSPSLPQWFEILPLSYTKFP